MDALGLDVLTVICGFAGHKGAVMLCLTSQTKKNMVERSGVLPSENISGMANRCLDMARWRKAQADADPASEPVPSVLMVALFRCVAIVCDDAELNDSCEKVREVCPAYREAIAKKLIRWVPPLTPDDAKGFIMEMSGTSDKTCALAVRVLRSVQGFDECLSARGRGYLCPLHCACIEQKPETTELLAEFYSGEDLDACVVGNGIVQAPLLFWLAVKWWHGDRSTKSRRILSSLIGKPDVNLHRVYPLAPIGDRKVMELLMDTSLPSDQDDLAARERFLRRTS